MSTPPKTPVWAYELAGQFVYNPTGDHQWHAKTISTDAGQVLAAGSDGFTAFLSQAAIQSVQAVPTLIYDATAKALVFSDGLGHTSSIPNATFDMHVNGAALNSDGTVLTLSETDGGPSVTLNFSRFLQQVAVTNTSAIQVTGLGTAASPLVISLYVDPTVASVSGASNLLKIAATGASVSAADVVTLMNSATTLGVAIDNANNKVTVTVNGHSASFNLIPLQDSSGAQVGNMIAMV